MNNQVIVYEYHCISFLKGKFRGIELHGTDCYGMYRGHRFFWFRSTSAQEKHRREKTAGNFYRNGEVFQLVIFLNHFSMLKMGVKRRKDFL